MIETIINRCQKRHVVRSKMVDSDTKIQALESIAKYLIQKQDVNSSSQ
jgi:hypothetical protein